jgi:hypothetical protein
MTNQINLKMMLACVASQYVDTIKDKIIAEHTESAEPISIDHSAVEDMLVEEYSVCRT